MGIHDKLFSIQSELKVPKGNYNNLGKYKYRSCEDILEALKPICSKNKVVIQITDEIKNIGQRYYVMAVVTLIDVETGEKISSSAFAREEETKKGMDGSQITGASSSYTRKYALGGLFGIDDTKDSDTTNAEQTNTKDSDTTNTYQTNTKKVNSEKIKPLEICEICRKEIKPTEKLSVDEIVKNSIASYKKKLCIDCCKNQKNY